MMPRIGLARVVPVVIGLTVALAACAGSGAVPAGQPAPSARGPIENVGEPPALGDSGRDGAGGDRAGGDQGSLADIAARRIVKTGEVTLEVTDVAAAVGRVRALALDLDGYVGGSISGSEEESASLTLRIPAERFDDALDAVRDLDGKVLAEATREEDVTSSIVDLEARIRNLRASEGQYRTLVERAEKVRDVLAVQERLDGVRGEIEQLSAQLEQLSGLANLSTLTVTLVPQDEPVDRAAAGWDPGGTLDSALAALVSIGQGAASFGIWLGVVGLPIAVVAALVALLAWRATPRWRRRVRDTQA